MNSLLILAAAATLGIEVGWEPLTEGGHEYTIEIEPQLLTVLKGGSDIISEVPPHLDVRRYRITVGTAKLARIDGAPQEALPGDPEPALATVPSESAPHEAAPPTEPEIASEAPSAADSPPPPADDIPHAPEHPLAGHANHGRSHGEAPATLPADDQTSKPIDIAQPAAHNIPIKTHPDVPTEERNAQKPTLEPSTERPWLPLSLAVVLLCCSLGGNVYLGWIAVEARRRYRQLASRPRVLAP